VIEKEKVSKKDFNKFSTLKKLNILDKQRQNGLKSKQDKKQNKIKWQINGVLDSYHKP